MFEKIKNSIENSRESVIDLQSLLVSIPALAPESGGEGEMRKSEALVEYLRRKNFPEPEFYHAPDNRVPGGKRPNLIYRIKGKSASRRVWIMSHLDIVPAGELSLWKSDPFKLRVDGDKIYGRGVEDNHQGMVASILAAKAFIDLRIAPEYDLCLLLVADEEVGSEYGIKYVLANHSLFSRDDLIIVPDSGEPDGAAIEVAEKSIMWLKVVTRGVQAHGSRPDLGRNAFRAASNLVVKLEELYKKFARKDELFQPPYSTFEPTKKEPNVPNVNTIPGEDVFHVDCRVLPGIPLLEVESAIRLWANEIERKYDVTIEFAFSQKAEAAPPTSVDSPVVRALAAAIKTVYKVEPRPYGIGGGTVAALFRRAGYEAAVWSKLNEVAHQPNEYASISNIIGDAQVFSHVCLNRI